MGHGSGQWMVANRSFQEDQAVLIVEAWPPQKPVALGLAAELLPPARGLHLWCGFARWDFALSGRTADK